MIFDDINCFCFLCYNATHGSTVMYENCDTVDSLIHCCRKMSFSLDYRLEFKIESIPNAWFKAAEAMIHSGVLNCMNQWIVFYNQETIIFY